MMLLRRARDLSCSSYRCEGNISSAFACRTDGIACRMFLICTQVSDV